MPNPGFSSDKDNCMICGQTAGFWVCKDCTSKAKKTTGSTFSDDIPTTDEFTCFGSKPGYQVQAENDCENCDDQDECLKNEG